MRLPSPPVLLGLAAAAGAVLVGLYVMRRGGLSQAATDAGRAAGGAVVNLAGGVVTGGVDAVANAAGLPGVLDTVTAPEHARYLIDRVGYFEASKWAGLPALVRGMAMDAGTGTPPPANSPAGRMLAGLTDTYQEARFFRTPAATWTGGLRQEEVTGDPYSPFTLGG